MSPNRKLSQQACLSTTFNGPLLYHNDTGLTPSIISRESMHKHIFSKTLNYKELWLPCIYGQGHQNKINSFLSPNNASFQVWWRKPHWFRRQRPEKDKGVLASVPTHGFSLNFA